MVHQFAAPGASTPARLRMVLRNRGGLALGLLQHGVNLWSCQESRPQRLVPDALCQPLDDRRRLSKRRVCLRKLTPGLIQCS
jgi:hypothetical protein